MKKLLLVGFIGGFVFLAGCQEKAHTVSEFKKNASLLNKVTDECKDGQQDDPASLECRNADSANQSTAADNAIKQGGGKVDSSAW